METLEIWEFTDHHPSGKDVRYQLEKRGDDLSIHSDDPEFARRRAEYLGDQVPLRFLKYLIDHAGQKCVRANVEVELWRGAGLRILDKHLSNLRNLLNDDKTLDKRHEVQSGRIVQTLKGGYIRFTPEITHTSRANS